VKYDYQLKKGKLKVKITSVETWDIEGIRSDNGLEDTFPKVYFQKYFKKIESDN
jgi:hypothetical protein